MSITFENFKQLKKLQDISEQFRKTRRDKQIELFEKHFGNEWKVTKESVESVIDDFDWTEFAEEYLYTDFFSRYKEIEVAAQDKLMQDSQPFNKRMKEESDNLDDILYTFTRTSMHEFDRTKALAFVEMYTEQTKNNI